MLISLQWRHNGRDVVSNHQPHDCLLNRLFRRRSKKTPKLCVTGLCAGKSPDTGEFPAQMASNAENVSIWWRSRVLSVIREIAWLPRCKWNNSERYGVTDLYQTTTITTKRKLCAPSDVMKWTHFPRYSYKGPVTRSFDVSLMCTWTNRWANRPDAESRRHGDHCDVTVMQFRCDILHIQPSLSHIGSVSMYTTRTFHPITFNSNIRM